MKTDETQLWVEKYRPCTLDDYVLDSSIKTQFQSMIDRKSLQNFSVVGIQGSGKTTLAKIMARAIDAEVLFIPCATEGTVDVLRSKISEFCDALSFDGRQKIVILDEIDSSSQTGQNSFQAALRTLIEAAQDDTRFIATANYVQKVIPPILSRCPVIPLRFSKQDLLKRIKTILDAEKTKYTRDSLKSFVEESFQYYPDCRRIVNYLQLCSASGELVVNLGAAADTEKTQFLDELVEMLKSGKDLLAVRQFYMKCKDQVSDYVALGSDFYNRVLDENLVTVEGAVKLTDFLYQLNMVIDKECGFFGMVCAAAASIRGR